MRILYHHRTLGDGAEGIHIREVVAALRDLGHDVRVVSLIGESREGGKPGNQARWKRLSALIPSSVYEIAELGYNIVGARKLKAAMREFRPDIIYDRYNSYSTAAVHVSRAGDLPLLLEVNSPVAYERSEYEHLRLKFPRLAQDYERWICSSADHVFAVSTPLKRHLVEKVGVPADKVEVLPNGANPHTFRPSVGGGAVRARYQLDGRVVIGFVGILRPWHGVEMLIDAVAALAPEFPALHLLIVGDGPIQGELDAHARAAGIADRVVFTGRLTHAEVRDHVAAMDIAVSPKATFYASPMKILEYMAMSKAVVAPDMLNIRDILEEGSTGVMFRPDSADALRESLRGLVQRDDVRQRLGDEARRRVEQRFNWRYNAEAVISAAERLLRQRGAHFRQTA